MTTSAVEEKEEEKKLVTRRKELTDDLIKAFRTKSPTDLVQEKMIPVMSALVDIQLTNYQKLHPTLHGVDRAERIMQLFHGVGFPARVLLGSGGVLHRPNRRQSMEIADTIQLEAEQGPTDLVSASLIMADLGTSLYDERKGSRPRVGLIYEPTLVSVEFASITDAYTKGTVPPLIQTDDGYYTTPLGFGEFVDYSKVEDVHGPGFPNGTIAGLALATLQGEAAGYSEMLIRSKQGMMGQAILGGILLNGAKANPDMIAQFREALDATFGPGVPMFSYDVFAETTPLERTPFGGSRRPLPDPAARWSWDIVRNLWHGK
jgi:hypothetical protein